MLLLLVILDGRVWFLQPLHILLGIAYVLVVPGYCLTVALFPRADQLDAVARVGISIGISVALVPVVAFLLDKLPWGIHPQPILIAEYGIIVLGMALGAWRRAYQPAGTAYLPKLGHQLAPWWRSLPRRRQLISLTLGSALALVILAIFWIFLAPPSSASLTEFYILGQTAQAQDYPRMVSPDTDSTVTVGIVNRERDTHTYRIEVWVTDGWNADQQTRVAQEDAISLAPGQRFEQPVTWRMPTAGNDQRVDLRLFRGDDTEPYRQLHLWLDVNPSQAGG